MLEFSYIRFTGGVLMPKENQFVSGYKYGNNSPADYFAHTLSISIVDRTNAPKAATLWLNSLLSLLP